MAHLLQIIIIVRICIIITAEWIEITQKPASLKSNRTKPSIKILKKTDTNIFFNSDLTTPSPLWIEYQRERFGNKQDTKSQKLIVSVEKHLKNSAQIVVPANYQNNNIKSTPRNQIFQAKTRIDVSNSQPGVEVEELPLHLINVETTSRRDMSHEDDDDITAQNSQHTEQIDDHETNNQTADDDTILNNEEPSGSGLQIPSIQGFLKFLKSIQRTWLRKSSFGIKHKINLLKKLRDNLMRTIEQKFSMLWLPNERQRRRKRGLLDESSLNFPPEAALISINFLTFAVFLIKLVLQVVHIVKSKHYNFTGLNTGTMQTINRAN